ncbi:MAG: 3-deoxy-D-manno-octulosonic acid kinase [Granulosicoccus sp.]
MFVLWNGLSSCRAKKRSFLTSNAIPHFGSGFQSVQIVTQKVPGSAGEVVRYVQDSSEPFDPICLDDVALAEKGLIQGAASAGRGNTLFFSLNAMQLVQRHYRRGGLVRHISKKHYLYTGLRRTRAMREFDILIQLQKKALPAPIPYASAVSRRGLLYTAVLVTHRLPGQTLAERLLDTANLPIEGATDESIWQGIGELIARFHVAGVFHADLNAHNVMLDEHGGPTLIDFDRGRIRPLPKDPARKGWCVANMDRLERSLIKIAESAPDNTLDAIALADAFTACRNQWARSLNLLAGV